MSGPDKLNISHLEDNGIIDSAAAVATDDEHSLTFREACKRYPKAVFWAIAISLTIVMEGYDTILIGNLFAYPSFKEKYGTYYPDLDQYVVSGAWQAGLGNAASCGAIIGLIINGYMTERFGHRIVIMVGLVVMSGLIFITAFAPSIQVLCVGQVLVGIPWGIFSIMGSAYASEVCPLALRGYLLSFVNICWVLGQLIAAGILQGLVNNTTKWSYRIPFLVQLSWPLPLFILAWAAPDSPWWLVRKHRLGDAERSLQRLTSNMPPEKIQSMLAMMVHTNNFEKAVQAESSYKDCFRGTNLRRTEVACMILSAQTLCGEAFSYQPTYFFTQAGLKPAESYKLNFGGMGVAFVGTCVSWILMTYFGRRKILITGIGLLVIDLLIIGCLSYTPQGRWAQAAFAILWLGIYSSCLGPESFTVAAEISATRLRAQTISIARNAYNVANIVDNAIEPYLINPTEAGLKGKTAFIWFGVAVLVFTWAVFRLPETRNLTYEELDVLFEKRTPAWKFTAKNLNAVMESQKIQELNDNEDGTEVQKV